MWIQKIWDYFQPSFNLGNLSVSKWKNRKQNKTFQLIRKSSQNFKLFLFQRCDVTIWDKTVPIPRSEFLSMIRGVDGVFCLLTDKIDEEILSAAGPQLKAVATMSVGYDHFDLKALKAHKIHVGYTPGVLTDATSELAVALLLATSRRIYESAQALRA